MAGQQGWRSERNAGMNGRRRWIWALAVGVTFCGICQGQSAEMESIEIRVEIDGALARSQVQQTWSEQRSWPTRGECLVESRNALAVAGELRLWLGQDPSPAEVVPAARAQEVFTRIEDRRKDPALLRQIGHGQWQISVFPVEKEAPRRTQFTLTELLAREGKNYVYRLPTFEGAYAQKHRAKVEIHLAQVEPAALRPGQENLEIVSDGQGGSIVRLVGGQDRIRAGATLTFPARTAQEPVLVSPAGRALIPVDVSSIRAVRHVGIVMDHSASMKGPSGQSCRGAVLEILSHLQPGDRFCIVRAGSQPELFGGGWTTWTGQVREEAIRFVRNSQPQGGSDLIGAIQAVTRTLREDEQATIDLFLLSDGIDQIRGRPEQEKLDTLLERVRFHCVEYHWHSEMHMLSEASGGRFVAVQPIWDIESEAREQKQRIDRMISEALAPEAIRAAVPDPDGGSTAVPVLLSRDGDTAWVAPGGAKDSELPDSLELSRGGKSMIIRLGGMGPTRRQEGLAKLAALAWAEDLLEGMAGEQAEARMIYDVMALCREHRIVSSAASMLVLESDEHYAWWGIVRQAGNRKPGKTVEVSEDAKPKLKRLREIVAAGRGEVGEIRSLVEEVAAMDVPLAQRANALREYLLIRMAARYETSRRVEARKKLKRAGGLAILSSDGPYELPPLPVGEVTIALQPARRAEAPGLRAKLAKTNILLPEENLTLKSVLALIREKAEVNVVLQSQSLGRDAWSGKDATGERLSFLAGRQFSAENLLDAICMVGFQQGEVRYEIGPDGVVYMGVKREMASELITRVYDWRDLLETVVSYRQAYPLARNLDASAFREPVEDEDDEDSGLGFADDDREATRGESDIYDVSDLVLAQGEGEDRLAPSANHPGVAATPLPDLPDESFFLVGPPSGSRRLTSRTMRELLATVEALTARVHDNRSWVYGANHTAVRGLLVSRDTWHGHLAIEGLLSQLIGRAGQEEKPIVTGRPLIPPGAAKRIDTPIKAVEARDVPLHKLLTYLETISGQSIICDWPELERKGIRKEDKLSLDLQNVSLRTTLKVLLRKLNVPPLQGPRVDWRVLGDHIWIGSQDAVFFPRVYDVRPLLDASHAEARQNETGRNHPGATMSELLGIFPHLQRYCGRILVKKLGRLDGRVVIRCPIRLHAEIQRVVGEIRGTIQNDLKVEVLPAEPDWPETMFDMQGKIHPWVLDLLKAAKDGKLSEYSSIPVRQAGGRTLARVGGIWIQADIGSRDVVTALGRQSRQAQALLKARESYSEMAKLGGFVLFRVAPGFAVSLEPENPPVRQEAARQLLEAAGVKVPDPPSQDKKPGVDS